MPFSIPFKDRATGNLQASQWQKIPVLLEADEMEELLDFLAPFEMIQTMGVVSIGQEGICRTEFLDLYRVYLSSLQMGRETEDSRLRPFFSSVWTTTDLGLYRVKIDESRCLIRVERPMIQLQPHRFAYSLADRSFRSQVMGLGTIPWGIQFSYPHLFQEENLQVSVVKDTPLFPNTALFKKLQQWIRSHTTATPLEAEGKKTNVPIRLGKRARALAQIILERHHLKVVF